MSTPNPTFNPIVTTNGFGSFNVDSVGGIQGQALDQPAIRNSLAGGTLDSAEVYPMWGGFGISEAVPTPGGRTLGGSIRRATSISVVGAALSLTGFSVFDQDSSMVNSPQSPVPLAGTGMQVNFYRLGSGARLWVACDPSLVSAEGAIITQQVSWDFNPLNPRLIPYVAAYPANVVTASSWANTAGGQVTFTTTTNHGVTVGSDFTIAGMTPDAYNGDYTAIAGTATNSLVAVKTVDPGASTVQGTLVAGGGAVPVSVLDIQVNNSMVVQYDPVTGFATWNRNGATAVIKI